jgi:hypothetical protein
MSKMLDFSAFGFNDYNRFFVGLLIVLLGAIKMYQKSIEMAHKHDKKQK